MCLEVDEAKATLAGSTVCLSSQWGKFNFLSSQSNSKLSLYQDPDKMTGAMQFLEPNLCTADVKGRGRKDGGG